MFSDNAMSVFGERIVQAVLTSTREGVLFTYQMSSLVRAKRILAFILHGVCGFSYFDNLLFFRNEIIVLKPRRQPKQHSKIPQRICMHIHVCREAI